MKHCPLCEGKTFNTICEFTDIPVFQNKVYLSEKEAKEADTGDVILMQCRVCGFVFNSEFNNEFMNYNSMYQNEQAHSEYFHSYLWEIVELLKSEGFLAGKIVEIGCGKGTFLELLLRAGIDAIGFDPAYEGENSRIIKDYFNDSYKTIKADTIILRHTLEHVQEPLKFLHAIGKANGYRGRIYIEVPCFDWIKRKNAFWDIYHEHCNYFTIETLKAMFTESSAGKLFGDQYLYLIAEFKDLKTCIEPGGHPDIPVDKLFVEELDRYKKFVLEKQDVMVWGAGAKGVTFVNLIDPYRLFIRGLVDINPKKQNRYVGRTAHKIYGLDVLRNGKVKSVIVMNENYLDEISDMLSNHEIDLYTLGVL